MSATTTLPFLGAAAAVLAYFLLRLSAARQAARVRIRVEDRRSRPVR